MKSDKQPEELSKNSDIVPKHPGPKGKLTFVLEDGERILLSPPMATGKIFLAEDEDGKRFAVKTVVADEFAKEIGFSTRPEDYATAHQPGGVKPEIKDYDDDDETLINEAKIYKRIEANGCHRNVMQQHGIHPIDDIDGKRENFLVLEYIHEPLRSNDIFDGLEKLHQAGKIDDATFDSAILVVLREAMAGLKHVNNADIYHRDPDANVLFDKTKNRFVVHDFGTSLSKYALSISSERTSARSEDMPTSERETSYSNESGSFSTSFSIPIDNFDKFEGGVLDGINKLDARALLKGLTKGRGVPNEKGSNLYSEANYLMSSIKRNLRKKTAPRADDSVDLIKLDQELEKEKSELFDTLNKIADSDIGRLMKRIGYVTPELDYAIRELNYEAPAHIENDELDFKFLAQGEITEKTLDAIEEAAKYATQLEAERKEVLKNIAAGTGDLMVPNLHIATGVFANDPDGIIKRWSRKNIKASAKNAVKSAKSVIKGTSSKQDVSQPMECTTMPDDQRVEFSDEVKAALRSKFPGRKTIPEEPTHYATGIDHLHKLQFLGSDQRNNSLFSGLGIGSQLQLVYASGELMMGKKLTLNQIVYVHGSKILDAEAHKQSTKKDKGIGIG